MQRTVESFPGRAASLAKSWRAIRAHSAALGDSWRDAQRRLGVLASMDQHERALDACQARRDAQTVEQAELLADVSAAKYSRHPRRRAKMVSKILVNLR